MAGFDLSGQRFGRLLVIGPAPRCANGRKAWHCRCDCGTEKPIQQNYLTTGDTRSCGCLFLEATRAKGAAKKIDLVGRIFGRLTVVEEAGRASNGDVLWSCSCSCGKTSAQVGSRLTRGSSRSCGCLRAELARGRARAMIGSIQRPKVCRVCSVPFVAIGPQKYCSPECYREWHADYEARRRNAGTLKTEIKKVEEIIRERETES